MILSLVLLSMVKKFAMAIGQNLQSIIVQIYSHLICVFSSKAFYHLGLTVCLHKCRTFLAYKVLLLKNSFDRKFFITTYASPKSNDRNKD